MDSDGTDIFGPGNSWAELYRATHAELKLSHWRHDRETVADAASEGYARALAKKGWSKLDHSTRRLQDRNWNYVKRIARLEACEWFRNQYAYTTSHVAASSLVPVGHTPEQEQDFMDEIYGTDSVDVVDAIVDWDLLDRAAAVIRELTEAEVGPWFEDLLNGVTVRQAEERDQVAFQRISEQRRRGLLAIRPVLERHGLIEEGAHA